MLVLYSSSMWKSEKENKLLEKSFMASELGLLLFTSLEKRAHPYLRQSSVCDVLRTEPGLSIPSITKIHFLIYFSFYAVLLKYIKKYIYFS